MAGLGCLLAFLPTFHLSSLPLWLLGKSQFTGSNWRLWGIVFISWLPLLYNVIPARQSAFGGKAGIYKINYAHKHSKKLANQKTKIIVISWSMRRVRNRHFSTQRRLSNCFRTIYCQTVSRYTKNIWSHAKRKRDGPLAREKKLILNYY